MKKIKLFTVFLALTAFIFSGMAMAQDKKDAEVTFVVKLDCHTCKKKIEDAIPYEKGVKDLKVDMEKKTVWIKYSPEKTDKEQLAKALAKIGFPPVSTK